ncbi:MAG TPA: hypothetical protein VGR84_11150 [Candidatus Acidoferrales bacterium]|nr:hypothetical protein [Candidatus Acidoferrales bacterium]
MPGPSQAQRDGDSPSKRLIVLGVLLAVVFVVWMVTMLAPLHSAPKH